MSGDPFAVLEAEHREALVALERMESAAHFLEFDPDSEPDRRTIAGVLGFLASRVREHNEKEERLVFPLLGAEGPAEVFVEEHRTLWDLETDLQRQLEAGDPAMAATALEIVALLRSHIERENLVLFPMARASLGRKDLQDLARNLDTAFL